MLYEYEKIKNNKWIIEERAVYDQEAGIRYTTWSHLYPHALYFATYDEVEYRNKTFDFVKFKRFCDRKLSGDVIYSLIDRSYTYKYYSDPQKTWDGSHHTEQWIFFAFNFELLCDCYLTRNEFKLFDKLPPVNARKPHHDWTLNEHIDCSDHDKYWDHRFKMLEKLRS